MILNIIRRLKTEIFYFFNKEYRNFILNKWFYYNILYKIFKKYKDIQIKISDVILHVPNQSQAFRAIEEIFIERVYNKLKNLNCILDLGSFLGESSIYFIKNKNNKVIAVEADPDKFRYLKENVKRYPNIVSYNKAVSSKPGKLVFTKEYLFDLGTSSEFFIGNKKFEVEIITIQELIDRYKPDGIKMDIEGSEFEILEWFLKNKNYFTFRKGYIEFHFCGGNSNVHNKNKIFKNFIELLKDNKYRYNINNNSLTFNQVIEKINKLKNNEKFIFHLYFEKY